MKDFQKRIDKARGLINNADFILLGAGAGLSTAAGFEYSGKNFDKYFKDFKREYGITDMYSGGFYPFETEEEKWAYWSRYVYINRYKSKANKLYQQLYDLIKNKDYFVITTNVDHQFQLSGFDKDKLFYTQGDYGLLQCSVPCHNKTYENKELIIKMLKSQNITIDKDGQIELINKENWKTKIDSDLIPKCPVCGRIMEMNLRVDDRFVQDDGWFRHAKLYKEFYEKIKNSNVVLIEIGVGYNTPTIIKYSFEQMTYRYETTYMIRINKDYAICPKEIVNKTVLFDENVDDIIKRL